MKKLLVPIGLVVLLAVIVVASIAQKSRKGTKVYEEEAKRIENLVSTVRASGEVQPKDYVNISSQVPGEIIDLAVKEGDRVRKGDFLLQLDPEQYRSNVARLEANLSLAGINLEKERTALATYANTLRRQEALAGEDIVSDETLEVTRLQHETSRIQVRALEEQIRQAEADLGKARDELRKTTITAPMDGLVTQVNAKVGEQVIIGTMNNPGTVILVLSDMSEMLAEVKVDETEVAAVLAGQGAVVTVDAIEDRSFEGQVTEIAHTAIKERDVSRFAVKVSLTSTPEGGGPSQSRELPVPAAGTEMEALSKLRPGMSAHAAIEVASREQALVVPIQAVLTKPREEVEEALRSIPSTDAPAEGNAGSIAAETDEDAQEPPRGNARSGVDVDVLFVDRDGVAQMIVVTTGLSDEFNVEILDAALQEGDRVVIGPYRTLKKLKHGDKVVKVEQDDELKEDS